jgi:hypothetical protein
VKNPFVAMLFKLILMRCWQVLWQCKCAPKITELYLLIICGLGKLTKHSKYQRIKSHAKYQRIKLSYFANFAGVAVLDVLNGEILAHLPFLEIKII